MKNKEVIVYEYQHDININSVISEVKQWLGKIVIGLNLCPFAKKEYVKDRIRFFVCEKQGEQFILQALLDEINFLLDEDEIETTLLILSGGLKDFQDYNQFLDLTDALLQEAELEGVFQIASFHPDYQFAETKFDDVENYTNRSPYPILHILREASLINAIDNYPDTEFIPENNIKLMNTLGIEKIKELYK